MLCYVYMCIYIYNYICVCMYVCVCVCLQAISVCARATGTLVYDGMSMLLIVDQTVGPFLVVVPVAKPETKCAPQFSCFDFWHSGSTSKTFLGDLKRLLDPYLLCLLLTESCMMGAYVTFNANVGTLAAGWWESFFNGYLSEERYVFVCFLPFAREQSLFVWFEGFHLDSGN